VVRAGPSWIVVEVDEGMRPFLLPSCRSRNMVIATFSVVQASRQLSSRSLASEIFERNKYVYQTNISYKRRQSH
jgi:hypothetical protein